MTELLKTYLKMAIGGKNEQKRLAPMVPKELSFSDEDGKTYNVREYLQMSSLEGTSLIQAEVLKTVIEGAEPAKCVRNIVPIVNCSSNSMTMLMSETGTYAPEVAEGASFLDKEIDYSTRTFTVKKYGVAIRITDEMIADSMVDVMNIEIQKAGLRVENALNKAVFDALLANSGWAQDLAGADLNSNGIAKAISTMQGTYSFNADSLICHPQLTAKLLIDQLPISSYWAGFGGGAPTTGVLSNVLGLKLGTWGGTYGGGTYTYGFNTNDYVGGILMDSKSAGAIAMRQDTQVENYRDVLTGLKGAVVSIRFGTNYLIANAIGRIQY